MKTKPSWVTPREDKVTAKGKGVMTTFWLSMAEHSSSDARSTSRGSTDDDDMVETKPESPLVASQVNLDTKKMRLVEWNVDVLSRMLKSIIAHRQIMAKSKMSQSISRASSRVDDSSDQRPKMVLDEVAEVIKLPKFHSRSAQVVEKAERVIIGQNVMSQLRSYVTTIASLYLDNSFHNVSFAALPSLLILPLNGFKLSLLFLLSLISSTVRTCKPRYHVLREAPLSYCCSK